jgi:hypothetical protein
MKNKPAEPLGTDLMRRLIRHTVLAVAVVCGLAPSAYPVTLHDIVALTNAGLSDDIIVALLEADPTIFSLDAQKLMELRGQGVSERVLIEMLRSGRQTVPAPIEPVPVAADPPVSYPQQQAPQVVIIDHQEPSAGPFYVPFPIFVPTVRTFQAPRSHATVEGQLGFGRFINDGTRREPPVPPQEPVYWGWGGKRRPDTWAEERKN